MIIHAQTTSRGRERVERRKKEKKNLSAIIFFLDQDYLIGKKERRAVKERREKLISEYNFLVI
jgi:hypothetical protein